jgi:hypothetical protein
VDCGTVVNPNTVQAQVGIADALPDWPHVGHACGFT